MIHILRIAGVLCLSVLCPAGPAGKHLVSSSTRGSSCASPASPLGYNAVFLQTHCWESNRHVQIHCDDIPCAVNVALRTEDSEGSLWVGWLHTSRDTRQPRANSSHSYPPPDTCKDSCHHKPGLSPSGYLSSSRILFCMIGWSSFSSSEVFAGPRAQVQ